MIFYIGGYMINFRLSIGVILFMVLGCGDIEDRKLYNKENTDISKVKIVKKGSRIKVHYILKLDDGTVVINSRNTGPLEVRVGDKPGIKEFNNALEGMRLNDIKKLIIEPPGGYGYRDENLVMDLNKDEFFGESADLIRGRTVHITKDGITKPARIVKVEGDIITVDFNHPMAGKTLYYEIEVVDIN